MIETITLALATPIVKAILDKFYEGVGTKLGEKAVEALPQAMKEKVTQLGQLIWDKHLKQESGTDQLLEKAANGSVLEQDELTQRIHSIVNRNDDLRQQSQTLANEIYQVIKNDVDAKNVQQIFGGQGLQVNETQDQPIIQIQGNPILNFGSTSSD